MSEEFTVCIISDGYRITILSMACVSVILCVCDLLMCGYPVVI